MMNTVEKMLILLTFAFFTLAASAVSALAEEDATRCPCWYDGFNGYDSDRGKDSCKNPPPDSAVWICDIIDLKEEWEDGCLSAHEKEKPKCPYKQ